MASLFANLRNVGELRSARLERNLVLVNSGEKNKHEPAGPSCTPRTTSSAKTTRERHPRSLYFCSNWYTA